MKTLYPKVTKTYLLFAFLMLCCIGSQASGMINIQPDQSIIDFIKANWSQIALIISESAALFPGKIKGIIQGILSVIPLFFAKKNK